MTAKRGAADGSSFVKERLPWLVGVGGLLVYLVTLNPWVSLLNLNFVAQLSGWMWQPVLDRPLASAVFLPVRLLPPSWIPLASNLLTVVCAAAVLVLLARSVSLLRHDVSPDDPLRRNRSPSILSTPFAWMPPVLAAIYCGFHLGFWEHATSATGEMVSLLAFAYFLRCVFEYRIDRRDQWLFRAALVYAAGMADGWVMLGFLPVFFASMLWLKGYSFWNPRFLLRLVLWGIAGSIIYLLIPVMNSFQAADHQGFWPPLMDHLKSQKHALTAFKDSPLRLLLVTAFVPFLLLAIRWKSHTIQLADDSRVGVYLVKASGHLVHALFFLASLWILLNPAFAPRHLALGTPMLIYHYTWAVVFGYCVGYFLLFDMRGLHRRWSRLPVNTVRLLLLILPLGLLTLNLPQIRFTNGPAVRRFARDLCDDAPEGRFVALSESPWQMHLLQAGKIARGTAREMLPLETPSLISAGYQEYLARRFAARWPLDLPPTREGATSPHELKRLIANLASVDPVVYVHPSSGLFFESFVGRPHGYAHYFEPRPRGSASIPPLSEREIAVNEQLWQQRWSDHLESLAHRMEIDRSHETSWANSFLSRLQWVNEQNLTATLLGRTCSKALDHWGVTLQRLGHGKEAEVWFERAARLNPDNLAALINLTSNRRRQQGEPSRLTIRWAREQFSAQFGRYDNWWEVVSEDGPVDEPTFLLQTGRILLATGNKRQALEACSRAADLAPDWLPPRLGQAQCHNSLGDYEDALQLTEVIQASNHQLKGPGLAQLLFCRTVSLRGLRRGEEADGFLDAFLLDHGEHPEVLSTAANLYARSRQFEQGLDLVNELVKRSPDDVELLVRKGLLELRLKRNGNAISTLSKALALSPSEDQARLLRALAFLRTGRMEDARSDYLELLKRADTSQRALFGLADIAWRDRDTNAVLNYYEQYLSNSIPGSVPHTIVSNRLNQLRDEQD